MAGPSFGARATIQVFAVRSFDRGLVYADAVIGPKRRKTPEGFLLCEDVPIARTGTQDYTNDEIEGVEPGRDGVIKVERRDDDVFRDETIRSFEGKDVTDDHPDDFVGPENFREHAVGTVLNPRRGEGAQADCIIADLLIKDADAIAAVESGKREVSCGYDADYESLGPGRARQHNIVGNHVALVDRGRCGHRCSIGDEHMANWKDKVMRLLAGTNDEESFMKGVKTEGTHDEGEGGSAGIHVHVHGGPEGETTEAPTTDANEERFKGLEGRMDSFEGGLKEIKDAITSLSGTHSEGEINEGEGDEEPLELQEEEGESESEGAVKDRKKVKDAAPLKAEHATVVAGCEILVPGFKAPTFDAKADAKKTRDSLCLARRRAVIAFAKTNDGAKVVAAITGVGTFDTKMPCAGLIPIFNASVAMTKDRRASVINLSSAVDPKTKGKVPQSIPEFNDMSRDFWNKQSAKK